MTIFFAALASLPLAVPPTAPLAAPIDDGGFDWVVSPHSTVYFDTGAQLLIDPIHGLVMWVEDGLLVCDDVHIGVGATVRVIGPNPLRILASGSVRIEGEVILNGHDASNVQSLNLATHPQPGGLAGPGGGKGGVGSPLTDASSPRGGNGEGVLGVPGLGGVGGESGYNSTNRNYRRPGGGGGGQLASWNPDPDLLATAGEDGFDSTHPGFQTFTPIPTGAFGAETGSVPPGGGQAGPSPLADTSVRNDFWGIKLTPSGRIVGELNALSGGSGGGGGGDSVNGDVFPSPVFQGPTGLTPFDVKGGAGGGGGGALHVVAFGAIVFGVDGHVSSDGGSGGTGESTFFIDRIGGGGGGGSGGHVVLESGRKIVFEGVPAEGDTLSAVGGDGGLGLPIGENPEGTGEFDQIFDVLGYPVNKGGQGGAGILQLHVPLAASGSQADNIVLPSGASLADLSTPTPHVLVPIFLPIMSAGAAGASHVAASQQ